MAAIAGAASIGCNIMSPSTTNESFATRLPRWQIILLLVGFPLVYIAHSFTPWSYRLFVEFDHGSFVPFAIAICVLHWSSVALTIIFVWRSGGRLADVGLRLRLRGLLLLVAVAGLVGGALIALRQTWPMPAEPPSDWQVLYPFSFSDRLLWIFISLTAGFCEEFVYRGFGIRVLQLRGWRTWKAALLTTFSFVFIHGIAGFMLFPFYIAAGLLFAGIFLWRKSLTPGIYCHTIFDMFAILAV